MASALVNKEVFSSYAINAFFTRLFGIDQGMLLQNYDPRGEYLGPLIERLFETGVTEHFMQLWMPYKDMAEAVNITEEVLQLQHFYLPLIFLSGGILMSILAIFIEISLLSSFVRVLGKYIFNCEWIKVYLYPIRGSFAIKARYTSSSFAIYVCIQKISTPLS